MKLWLLVLSLWCAVSLTAQALDPVYYTVVCSGLLYRQVTLANGQTRLVGEALTLRRLYQEFNVTTSTHRLVLNDDVSDLQFVQRSNPSENPITVMHMDFPKGSLTDLRRTSDFGVATLSSPSEGTVFENLSGRALCRYTLSPRDRGVLRGVVSVVGQGTDRSTNPGPDLIMQFSVRVIGRLPQAPQ